MNQIHINKILRSSETYIITNTNKIKKNPYNTIAIRNEQGLSNVLLLPSKSWHVLFAPDEEKSVMHFLFYGVMPKCLPLFVCHTRFLTFYWYYEYITNM